MIRGSERRHWLTEQPPPTKALFNLANEPWLPEGVVCGLVGAGGAGKTQAAIQLAAALTVGGQAFGEGGPRATRKGRALLVLFEVLENELWQRLHGLEVHMDALDVLLPTTDAEADNVVGTDELAQLAAGYDLVVIEPVAQFAGADVETDNNEATKLVKRLSTLTRGGATVLYCHHTAKVDRRAENARAALHNPVAGRGSSALTDASRWVANLVEIPETAEGKADGYIGLQVAKANLTPRGHTVKLERASDGPRLSTKARPRTKGGIPEAS